MALQHLFDRSWFCARGRRPLHHGMWLPFFALSVMHYFTAVCVADDTPTAAQTVQSKESGKPKYTLERLSGKVVFLAEAMKRLHGVETDADARHSAVALETADGQLHPILKDARGRGFLLDERLRGVEMELLVCRYPGSPVVQVVRVYALKNGRRYEQDYWCDICAIVMYELKECECCQGPIRIRQRLVDEKTGEAAPRD